MGNEEGPTPQLPPRNGAEEVNNVISAGGVGADNNVPASNDNVPSLPSSLFPSIAAGMASGGGLRLYESDRFLSASLDLPGVRVRDFKVFVRYVGVLYIEGVRVFYHDDEDRYPNVAVKRYMFSQTFIVNTDEVNLRQAKANLSNGVLVVKAPKYRNNEARSDESITTFSIPVYDNGVPPSGPPPEPPQPGEFLNPVEEDISSGEAKVEIETSISSQSPTDDCGASSSTDSSGTDDATNGDVPQSSE